jgi:hypothetical protein
MNLLKDDDDRVKIAGTDTDGIARGKIISRDKFLKIINHGMGFCDVIFVFISSKTRDGIVWTSCIRARQRRIFQI